MKYEDLKPVKEFILDCCSRARDKGWKIVTGNSYDVVVVDGELKKCCCPMAAVGLVSIGFGYVGDAWMKLVVGGSDYIEQVLGVDVNEEQFVQGVDNGFVLHQKNRSLPARLGASVRRSLGLRRSSEGGMK